MSKINLSGIVSGFNLSKINDNFTKIADALNNKVLYRDNPVGENNSVNTDIDMNNRRIYNLPTPVLDSEPTRLQDIKNIILGNSLGATPSLITQSTVITTAGQTVVTVPLYTIGSKSLEVFKNGKRLLPVTEYTETSTTSITLATPATAGDVIYVRAFQFIVFGSVDSANVSASDGTGGTLFSTVQGFINKLLSSIGSSIIGFIQPGNTTVARNVQDKLREVVSVKDFGALGNGSVQYTAFLNAFNYCVQNKKDLYIPAGIYSSGTDNFPFKHPVYPASDLLDCNGITIYGDGENTLLISESSLGADVLNLYSVKNLHIRDLAVSATLSGTSGAGSNGVSIVGGFDNVTVDNLFIKNLPYVDKGTYLDGGKALTIQTGTPATECGVFRARNIFADGCVHGFGIEIDLPNWATKKHSVDVEITARNCFTGALVSAGASSGALSASMTSGINIKATAIDCQRSITIGRGHGIDIEGHIITTKTPAQRRLNPTGGAWNSTDNIVDGFFAAYLKNSRVSISGDLGGCDYKVQIGGATAGSSGQGGASENNKYYFDIAGSSTITDVNVIDSGGNTVKTSDIYVSASTTPTLPASLYAVSNGNMVAVGPSYRFYNPKINGSLLFMEPDGNSSYLKILQDGYGLSVNQTGASSTSNLNFSVKTHTGSPAFAIRNDGAIATSGRATASSVTTIKGVMPIYAQDNTLYGYVPVYTTYS